MRKPLARRSAAAQCLGPKLAKFSIVLCLALGAASFGTGPSADAQQRLTTADALRRALDRRLTVWRTDARSIHVRHCRSAPGGCARRVATFAHLIDDASARHRLDPFLLAAVAFRESGMDPLAEGAAGERGIVQLHPRGFGSRARFVRSEGYRQRCARQDTVCQEEILEIGAQLLARSIDRCGSIAGGLGAYNRGLCGATSYSTRVMRERRTLVRLAKEVEGPPVEG